MINVIKQLRIVLNMVINSTSVKLVLMVIIIQIINFVIKIQNQKLIFVLNTQQKPFAKIVFLDII